MLWHHIILLPISYAQICVYDNSSNEKTVTEVETEAKAAATAAAATLTETTDYISKITIISRHFSKEIPWNKLAKSIWSKEITMVGQCVRFLLVRIDRTEIGLVSPCWFSHLINLLDSSLDVQHLPN